jgi:hypothetical protein
VSDTDLQINVTDLAAGNRLFAAHTN